MPVLVIVREAGESGHRTRVVVSYPLDHLPHLLPPLLLLQKPRLLVSRLALPANTHTVFNTSRLQTWRQILYVFLLPLYRTNSFNLLVSSS